MQKQIIMFRIDSNISGGTFALNATVAELYDKFPPPEGYSVEFWKEGTKCAKVDELVRYTVNNTIYDVVYRKE